MHKEDYYAVLILMVGLLAAMLSGFFREATSLTNWGRVGKQIFI